MTTHPAPDAAPPIVRPVLEAATHLHACMGLLLAAPSPANRQLAAAARDRLAVLIATSEAGAEALLGAWQDSPLQSLFSEARIVDAILGLPAPGPPVRRAWSRAVPSDAQRLLGGVLMHKPWNLPGLADLAAQSRFDEVLLHYVTWHPKCFDRDAERDAYMATYIALCDALTGRLDRPDEPLSPMIDHCLGSLRSGAVYSCEGDLRAFAEAKGRLICAYVRRKHGLPTGETAPRTPLPAPAARTRLGLLWNDVDARTENAVGVASARHLRRRGFHVVSVIHHRGYFVGHAGAGTSLADEVAGLSDEVIDLDAQPRLHDKARAIEALDLDCLVFMNNVTFGYNEYVALATLRLARRQAVNLCAVVTTGFPAVDLYLSGVLSERAADPDRGYTERLLRLPGTPLIFDRAGPPENPRLAVDAAALRDPDTVTLFASGANFYKLNPVLTETWARVLAAAPGSRLVLYPYNPNWDTAYPTAQFVQRFSDQLVAHGVDPARVTIAGPWRDAAAVQALLAHVDVYLDSFPHSGGQSSLDALRQAIPVVTKRGTTQRENQSADLLDLLGLSERVATSLDAYVETAGALARNLADWAAYRAAIARAMPTARFFDTEAYAEGFARTLREALLGPSVPVAEAASS